ncbi:type II toxin-antitoxin system RelE family toxin [Helicobacter sp. T3_23-1059]
MEIRLSNQADKFLDKQYKGDPNGIHLVRLFINEKLPQATNSTALPNCKKMQGTKDLWRWRVSNYRIIGRVKNAELIIEIIKISTREGAY